VSKERQVEFLYRSIERNADWVKYEDAKAGAVIVILAIGCADLIGHARFLADAHSSGTTGVLATIVFWVAVLFAAATVVFVGRTVLPTVKTKRPSLYFFGTVTEKYADYPGHYRRDVSALGSGKQLIDQLAPQAWRLAQIASAKVQNVRYATLAVLGFIAAWAVARILLHLS